MIKILSRTGWALIVAFIALSFTAMGKTSFAQETLRQDSFYQHITKQADQGGQKAVLGLIERDGGLSPEQHNVMLQWLKDRVFTHLDPDPFYALYYSDLLFGLAMAYDRAARPQEAEGLYATSLFALGIFELMILGDAARCDDKSVSAAVFPLLSGRYSHFYKEENEIEARLGTPEKQAALAYEERHANRPPYPPICMSGMKAMQHALSDPNHTKKTVKDDNMLGGERIEVSPQTPYQPDFISDQAWREKRRDIRSAFAERD